jgi:FixJ family two-component response regulator
VRKTRHRGSTGSRPKDAGLHWPIRLQERLIEAGRPTPIIFVTAISDERIRNQVLEARAIEILSKPSNDGMLAGCLVSALNGL